MVIFTLWSIFIDQNQSFKKRISAAIVIGLAVVLLICVGLLVSPSGTVRRLVGLLPAADNSRSAASAAAPAGGPATTTDGVTGRNAPFSLGPRYSAQELSPVDDYSREARIARARENKTAYCGMTAQETLQYLESDKESDPVPIHNAVKMGAAALARSSVVEDQILGLTLQATVARGEAESAARLIAPRCNPEDIASADCANDVAKMVESSALGSLVPLIELAVVNKDLNAHATAAYACIHIGNHLCPNTNMRTWAELEPDNAVPWLILAVQAREKGDTVALNDAMKRAAQAKTFNKRLPKLTQILETETVKTLPPMVQIGVGNFAAGHSAALSMLTMAIPLRYCIVDKKIPAELRETCNRIAENFELNSDDSVGPIIAAKLGEALGWEVERVTALQDEYEVYPELLPGELGADHEHTCENINKQLQFVIDEGKLGLRQYAKQWTIKSGKSAREIGDKARAKRAAAAALLKSLEPNQAAKNP